jgi:gamma-glutamyltranspeptidase/glutathione hydrolase
MTFADRDFYYGDPYFPPEEPMKGLLSKDYAKQRVKQMNMTMNDPKIKPGDPYPFEGKTNPYTSSLEKFGTASVAPISQKYLDDVFLGTTSVEATDKEGWVVSIVPSGGWIPACIAGKTGVGMSQRMQSFVARSCT